MAKSSGMYNLVILDFVAHDTRVAVAECSWKQAKKVQKILEKQDRFCRCVIVPFGISLSMSLGNDTIDLQAKLA